MVGGQFVMRPLQVLPGQGPEILGNGCAGADGDDQGRANKRPWGEGKETGHQVRLRASKRDRDGIKMNGRG